MRPELLENPFTFNDLYIAANQCKKSVGWKESVTLWMDHIFENLAGILDDIDNETYEISAPTVFHIKDPKPRTISATKFIDRVVQRLICNTGTYWEITHSLIFDNCACQKGKGTSFTFERVKFHLHEYYKEYKTNEGYCIKLDIRKYFPSIPHEILKQKLKKYVKRERIRKMIDDIVDDFVKLTFDDDLSFCQEGFGTRGIGLGSQLCQLFALLYLSELDHYLKEIVKVRHYIRYMDDMLIIVRTEDEAKKIFEIIKEQVGKNGLTLNDKSRYFNFHNRRIDFLKVDFELTQTGKVKHRIKRECLNREITRIHKMCRQFKNNEISYRKLLQHLNTWSGFVKIRASSNQVKNIKKILRREFENFEKITPEIVKTEEEIMID